MRCGKAEDRYNRKINYLRISITDLCNLRCLYCMPEEGVDKKCHKDILTFEEIIEVARAAAGLGIDKIRITGGEPLVRKGIVEFVEGLSQIEGIRDIAMTTNGSLLKKYAQDLKNAGLNRVNISIDSLKAEKYKEITRGGKLKDVLDGIHEAIRVGMYPVKLNVVAIGGYNEDEILDFVNLTLDKDIEVRFIELMPIGEAGNWSKERFISNDYVKERIGNLLALPHKTSSPAQYFKLPGAKGKVGFIDPISNHFCSECNRIRLTSDGKLRPCLHSDLEVDIVEALRGDRSQVRDILQKAISLKPKKHYLYTEGFEIGSRNMSEIGG